MYHSSKSVQKFRHCRGILRKKIYVKILHINKDVNSLKKIFKVYLCITYKFWHTLPSFWLHWNRVKIQNEWKTFKNKYLSKNWVTIEFIFYLLLFSLGIVKFEFYLHFQDSANWIQIPASVLSVRGDCVKPMFHQGQSLILFVTLPSILQLMDSFTWPV